MIYIQFRAFNGAMMINYMKYICTSLTNKVLWLNDICRGGKVPGSLSSIIIVCPPGLDFIKSFHGAAPRVCLSSYNVDRTSGIRWSERREKSGLRSYSVLTRMGDHGLALLIPGKFLHWRLLREILLRFWPRSRYSTDLRAESLMLFPPATMRPCKRVSG